MELLFEQRLLNESDVQSVVQALSVATEAHTRTGLAIRLCELQRSEAVPILAEMLNVPFMMEVADGSKGELPATKADLNAERGAIGALDFNAMMRVENTHNVPPMRMKPGGNPFEIGNLRWRSYDSLEHEFSSTLQKIVAFEFHESDGPGAVQRR